MAPGCCGPRLLQLTRLWAGAWSGVAWLATLVLLLQAGGVAGVELHVAPSNPLQAGTPLLLSWQDLDSPSPHDWIGVYAPSTSPDSDWIGWFNLTASIDWTSGVGALNVTLRDLRSAYQFRLFTAPPDIVPPLLPTPLAPPVAVTPSVSFSQAGAPQHVHLALTASPSEMRVMWTSPQAWPGSSVQYGRDPAALSAVAGAEGGTYTQEDMCEAPAKSSQGWRDPGIIYDAVMPSLESGAKYFYRVGSDAGGWSDTYDFVTQPKEPAETYALIFGDMGVDAAYLTYERLQTESVTTLQLMQRDRAALGDRPLVVSHIGDISYARGRAWLWDEFMGSIEPLARHVPYHVAIGNHEYNWPSQPWNPDWASYGHDSGGECGVPYSARFHMAGSISAPTGTAAPPTRNVWYSVDVGTVHFTYISTEHDFLRGETRQIEHGPQWLWLQHDLASVDRQRTPFVVLSGHRPMYTSNNEERDREKRAHMLAALEPLLVEYQVSLCLWGHVHKFERTCPLANFTCHTPQEGTVPPPVHAVIGMAGQDWQPSWAPLDGQAVPIFPIPAWSLFRQDGYGYCRLHANRDTLRLTYITNHDGEQHDVVDILSPAAYLAGTAEPLQPWGERSRGRQSWERSQLIVGASVVLSATLLILWVATVVKRRRNRVGPGKGAWDQVASEEEVGP